MVFAIDIGNSSITAGVVDVTGVLFVERISTAHARTDLEYAMALKAALDLHGLDAADILGCIISSVAPEMTGILSLAAEKVTGQAPLIVGPGIRTGLNIRIDHPAQLGSDLVVSAVAAVAEYPLPLILIDMGTATTFSAIGPGGEYLGGSIVPGPQVSLDSLVSTASQLPRISLTPPKRAIGRNTVDCMRSGSFYGNAALIDGMITCLSEELGDPACVVATGTPIRAFLPYCRHEILYDETMPLKGLYQIFRRNVR